MVPGALIALEGIDGAGTTTQAHRLVDWLQATGQLAHFTCEPSTGPVGALIRQLLRGSLGRSLDPAAVALLFAADRVDHLQAEILPHLRRGCHVVTDRYLFSSLAYQSVAQDLRWIEVINRLAPVPHLTIYLQVAPEIALARRLGRGQDQELFEDPKLQQKIAANYDRIFDAPSPGEARAGQLRSGPWIPRGCPPSESGRTAASGGISADLGGSGLPGAAPRLLVLDGGGAVEQLHQQIIAEVQKVALLGGS